MDRGYEFGPSTWLSIAIITVFTIMFICFEWQRRKALNLLDNGYYFVEEFVNLKRKRLVAVPPENVDASNPADPRIINPSLIEQDCCC